MDYFKKLSIVISALMAALAVAWAAPATAAPIVHNGATFEVEATAVDSDTVDFIYTADFDSPGWVGSGGLDYIIAVDLGLGGYAVDTVDLTFTSANGTWIAGLGPSNANGCNNTSGAFACAEDDPFTETTGALTTGILQWMFTVTFTTSVDPADFTNAANHIGGFFQRCDFTPNPNDGDARRCQSGLGLSQTVSFTPGDDPDPDPDPDPSVPVPGTLALFGLGILALRLSRKERRYSQDSNRNRPV